MQRWYTIHTKLNVESRVAALLEGKGLETFLPKIYDINASRIMPLFPRYLFVHLDLEHANPNAWRWTPGVKYLVTYGDEPVAIPDYIISALKAKATVLKKNGEAPASRFRRGDPVRLKEGIFQDLLGVFDTYLSSKQRVQILLKTLERSVRLRVRASEIEVAKKSDLSSSRKRPRRTRGRGRPIRSD